MPRLMSMLSVQSHFLRGIRKFQNDDAIMSGADEAGAATPDPIEECSEMVQANEEGRSEPEKFKRKRTLPEIVGRDWQAEDSVESAIMFHKEVNDVTMDAITGSGPLKPSTKRLFKVPLRPRRKAARNNLAESRFAADDGVAGTWAEGEGDSDDEPDSTPERPIRSAKQWRGYNDKSSERLSKSGASGAASDERAKWATTKGLRDATNPLLRESESSLGDSRIQVVVALYDHIAEASGELHFLEGEEIEVLCKHDGDWWEGKNSRTGEKGIFPVSYTTAASRLSTQQLNF